MATGQASPSAPGSRWFIVSRWEEFEGEGRANLLRVVGILVFYAVELINYYGLRLGVLEMPPVVSRPFHLAVTVLTVAWTMVCLGVYLARQLHYFPAGLKFISTGADLLLLTTILALGDGARSPLVVAYFLILVLAALRFSLPLVWFATAGAVAGYVFLLGFARWGTHPWPDGQPQTPLPRYHQLIFLLALVLTGVLLGQIIRRVRGLAEGYAGRNGI